MLASEILPDGSILSNLANTMIFWNHNDHKDIFKCVSFSLLLCISAEQKKFYGYFYVTSMENHVYHNKLTYWLSDDSTKCGIYDQMPAPLFWMYKDTRQGIITV